MVAPVITPNLTLISTCDATTGWSGFNDGSGGSPSPVLETDVFIQGTGSLSFKISGTNLNRGLHFDFGGGSEVDFTVTGRHYFAWMASLTVGNLFDIKDGGVYVRASSDTLGNDWSKWFVGGGDTITDAGFVKYIVDLNKVPSETAATPCDISAVRFIGMGVKQTGSAKSENFVIDRCDYGTGLEIHDGDGSDPATWQALFDADGGTSTAGWGIIEKESGVFYLNGGIEIGQATSSRPTTWVDDSGAIVKFRNPLYSISTANADLTSSIDAANLLKILIQGNSTAVNRRTDVTFGSVVGSSDSRQGIQGGVIGTDGPEWTFDGETDVAEINNLNLYGLTFQGAGVTKFDTARTSVIGSIFIGCGEVQPNNAEFLNNTVIAPKNRGVELLSTNTLQQIAFVAGGGNDTVTLFGSAANGDTTAVSTALTWTHTISTGSEVNTAIVVYTGLDLAGSSNSVKTVDFKGQSLTKIVESTNALLAQASVWVLFSPILGAGTVTVQIDSTIAQAFGGYSEAMQDVVQSVPIRIVTNSGGSSGSSINIVAESTRSLGRDFFFGNASGQAPYTQTGGAQNLEIRDVALGTDASYVIGGLSDSTGGVETLRQNATSTGAFAHVGVEFLTFDIEHHVHLPSTADYTINFDALNFFGFGADGGPKWHAEVSGSGSTVIISALNLANPNLAEVELTGQPTLPQVAVNNNVTLTVTCKDEAGVKVQNARCYIERSTSTGVLMNKLASTLAGVASTSFNFSVDTGINIRVRRSSTAFGNRFFPFVGSGTIDSGGFSVDVRLIADGIASTL